MGLFLHIVFSIILRMKIRIRFHIPFYMFFMYIIMQATSCAITYISKILFYRLHWSALSPLQQWTHILTTGLFTTITACHYYKSCHDKCLCRKSFMVLTHFLSKTPGGKLIKSKDKATLLINTKMYSRKLYQLYSLKSALSNTVKIPIRLYDIHSEENPDTEKKKNKNIKMIQECLLLP